MVDFAVYLYGHSKSNIWASPVIAG